MGIKKLLSIIESAQQVFVVVVGVMQCVHLCVVVVRAGVCCVVRAGVIQCVCVIVCILCVWCVGVIQCLYCIMWVWWWVWCACRLR